MRRRILSLALASAAALAVGGASGSVASARPGGSAGWRLSFLRTCGNGGALSSVTATGLGDAWAVGEPDSAGPSCVAEVVHWNGRRWRHIPVSARLAGVQAFPLLLTASSATNAWIFPETEQFPGGCRCSYFFAARWNGRKWRTSRFPAKIFVVSAATFSPADTWAFGWTSPLLGPELPYAARYDGRAWHRVRLPGAVLAVSALSRRDMWAIGPTLKTATRQVARQAIVAMHWNGRSWHAITAPRIATRTREYDSDLYGTFAAAAGPHELWWGYQANAKRSSLGLLRWDGTQWHQIKLPKPITGIIDMAQDGRGGIWLITSTDDKPQDGCAPAYWYHYNRRWTRQLVPCYPKGYSVNRLYGLGWIPRTTGVWAAGQAYIGNTFQTVSVIARYHT